MFLNCWCCCCSFRVVKPTFLSPSTTFSAWGSSVECTPHSRRTSRDTQGCLGRGLLWFFCRTASTICMAIASSFYVDLSRNRKLDDIWHVWACLYILLYNHIYNIYIYIYDTYLHLHIYIYTYIYIYILLTYPGLPRCLTLLDSGWREEKLSSKPSRLDRAWDNKPNVVCIFLMSWLLAVFVFGKVLIGRISPSYVLSMKFFAFVGHSCAPVRSKGYPLVTQHGIGEITQISRRCSQRTKLPWWVRGFPCHVWWRVKLRVSWPSHEVFTSPVGGQFVVEYVVCIILIGCWILLTGGNLLSTRREQGRLCLAVHCHEDTFTRALTAYRENLAETIDYRHP